MAFFNKKQEVLDIQLTPYGEDLLSRGKFKPVYYAFFDDDVLYDASGSAGIIETQNDAEPRIQENTPKSKIQYVFSGPEKRTTERIRQAWEEIANMRINVSPGYSPTIGDIIPSRLDASLSYQESLGVSFQDYFYVDRNPPIFTDFSFVEPLGSMEIGSEHAPSWRIIALNGEVSGAINYMTSSAEAGIYNNVRRIPQVDFDVDYYSPIPMFGTKTIDHGSSYLSFPSYAGGNYIKFTAPVAGLYQLELIASVESHHGGDWCQMGWEINTTSNDNSTNFMNNNRGVLAVNQRAGDDTEMGCHFSTTIYMAANDYAVLYQQSTAAVRWRGNQYYVRGHLI